MIIILHLFLFRTYRHYFSNPYILRFASYTSWLANDNSKGKSSLELGAVTANDDNDIEQGQSVDTVTRVNIHGEQETLLQRLVEALPYPCRYYLCLPLGV